MRVIAGKYKGRILFPPKSEMTRPTTDVVKEAIFCKLADGVENKIVLDLFAGSGALGIEAISRGANFVDFVDRNIHSVMLVKKNLENVFKSEEQTNFKVYKYDCRSFLKSCTKKYDIIFLDPPYESGLYEICLSAIFENKILNDDGIVVCEHNSDFVFETFEEKVFSRKKYGNTSVSYISY